MIFFLIAVGLLVAIYIVPVCIRIPFNFLIEKALVFGQEEFGLNIRSMTDVYSRHLLREICAARKPLNKYNHIEIFFALVPAALPFLQQQKRNDLVDTIKVYFDKSLIEVFIFEGFMAEVSNTCLIDDDPKRLFKEGDWKP